MNPNYTTVTASGLLRWSQIESQSYIFLLWKEIMILLWLKSLEVKVDMQHLFSRFKSTHGQCEMTKGKWLFTTQKHETAKGFRLKRQSVCLLLLRNILLSTFPTLIRTEHKGEPAFIFNSYASFRILMDSAVRSFQNKMQFWFSSCRIPQQDTLRLICGWWILLLSKWQETVLV